MGATHALRPFLDIPRSRSQNANAMRARRTPMRERVRATEIKRRAQRAKTVATVAGVRPIVVAFAIRAGGPRAEADHRGRACDRFSNAPVMTGGGVAHSVP